MRFTFDRKKSQKLQQARGISLQEAQKIFASPYYMDQRSDLPEQYRAIGFAKGRLYTVIFEVRADLFGEYYHLITLWKSTPQEEKLYENA